MSVFEVDTTRRLIALDGGHASCAIGRAGAVDATSKREGDGKTPLGTWPVRGALLRPDRGFAPPLRLPWRWLRPGDGWSDDPEDGAYNRAVRLPHGYSAERLWRDDTRYDVICWLGHNDSPPRAGAGSAIFLHIASPSLDPTAGCIAVAPDTMARLLEMLEPGDTLAVR